MNVVTKAPEVPEGQLLEMVQTVYRSMPAKGADAEQLQRRLLATAWLRDLVVAVHQWNLEFIGVLEKYPGFKNSKNPNEYAKFFDNLLQYREQLLKRGGGIKQRLCARLIHLNEVLDRDFAWLAASDPGAFSALKTSSNESYQSEVGVIGLALNLISRLVNPIKPLPQYADPRQEVQKPGFLNDQIAQSDTVRQIIEDYSAQSRKIIEDIRDFSVAVDAKLLTIEDFERRESKSSPNQRGGLLVEDTTIVQTTNSPQIKVIQQQAVDARLYTILAFCFGVAFLGILLGLTVLIPNPTKPQLRFWISILALAAGAVSTVISGLINVRLSLGKQLSIGATGALAVFVIVFFQNPAIFSD